MNMPPRSIASATVAFGLVSVPVEVYSSGESAGSVSFNMLHKDCGTRLKQQYICPKDEVVVDRENTVKGYEFEIVDCWVAPKLWRYLIVKAPV